MVRAMKLWVDIARQRNWSAESGADARCWMMTSVVGRLRRANEILTTASAFCGTARPGTALMVAYVDEFRDRFRVGIGRGRVTSVMREPGIRGVRRGGTPVTARLARGAGGGPGLVGRGFETGRRTRRTGLGLQDTGTDRNRVLREPSGASRPTIRAEQKTGHINVPDGTFAPPLVRLCGPVVSACRRTAPGRSRRRTRGSQPDARPSATASGRSSPE